MVLQSTQEKLKTVPTQVFIGFSVNSNSANWLLNCLCRKGICRSFQQMFLEEEYCVTSSRTSANEAMVQITSNIKFEPSL